MCGARGLRDDEVERQVRTVGEEIKHEVEEGLKDDGAEVVFDADEKSAPSSPHEPSGEGKKSH